jgi:hypothetical protein
MPDVDVLRARPETPPCCETGRGGPVVGNLMQASLQEILDGEALRAVRASILDGRPILPCRVCDMADPISFREFPARSRRGKAATAMSASKRRACIPFRQPAVGAGSR